MNNRTTRLVRTSLTAVFDLPFGDSDGLLTLEVQPGNTIETWPSDFNDRIKGPMKPVRDLESTLRKVVGFDPEIDRIHEIRDNRKLSEAVEILQEAANGIPITTLLTVRGYFVVERRRIVRRYSVLAVCHNAR